LLFRAFATYVRPLLEYNSPVWSPTYVYLKDKLESVQRRFTKCLNGFDHISYAARLDHLKSETLELRRLKSDLTMMFSINNLYSSTTQQTDRQNTTDKYN